MGNRLDSALVGVEAVLGSKIMNDPRVTDAFNKVKKAADEFDEVVIYVVREKETTRDLLSNL